MEFIVEICCRDEDQPSRSHHRSTVILCSGIPHALGCKFWIFSKGTSPNKLSSVQIDGSQCAPRWLKSGISVIIEKFVISIAHILRVGRRRSQALRALVDAGINIVHDSAHLVLTPTFKPRHSACAMGNQRKNIAIRVAATESD